MKKSFRKYFSLNDLMLVGALLVALLLGWNTITSMQLNYRLQQKQDWLAAEVELQELTNQNLKYTIAYLKTNDYLELAAREKFNKTTPGETLVYLPGSGQAEQAPIAKNTVTTSEPESQGWRANVGAWWQFVRGRGVSGSAS